MTSPEIPEIQFPTEEELRASAQKRFMDIRQQQELDRAAAQQQAQQVFGEGSLGRVEQGRAPEVANILALQGQQATSGAAGLEAAAARRQQTIAEGGRDPAFQQIEEAAQRAQDVQTQTSLRQLRGDLGAQGVRGGVNIQRQLQTLGGANLAESQLQAQLAQARLGRVSEAEAAEEGLQRSIAQQRASGLQQAGQGLFQARAEEAARAETNTQRALQERLGRLQLTESRAQAGTLERAAATQEVSSQAQLQAQLEQANIANKIALIEANKPPAQTTVHDSGKIICTELHRQGYLSDEVYQGDCLYSVRVPLETKIGYWFLASPLVKRMPTSKALTLLALPIGKAWATEMAHRVGKSEKGSILGRLVSWIGEPLCNLVGRGLIRFNLVNPQHIQAPATYKS